MAAVYVVQPDNEKFLSSFSDHPLIKQATVEEIRVYPDERKWIILLKDQFPGNQELWDQVAAKVSGSVGQVDRVEFEWKKPKDDYMEQVVKSFPGPEVITTTPPPNGGSNTNGNGNGGGRRRNGGRTRVETLSREIKDSPVKIRDIIEEEQGVTIQGEIFRLEQRETRTGKFLVMFDVFDGTDSITCKFFLDEPAEIPGLLESNWVKVKGNVQYQSFDGELSIMCNQINQVESPPQISDTHSEKRVEFHLHTKMSGMDGLIDVADAVKQAGKWGHPAVAITDHGVIQAFPEAYFAGKKHGVKIIYGLEGYLVDGEKDRPYHIIILAQDEQGLKNLYKLVSSSHMDHFYRRPRIPRKELVQHRTGLIIGSACEAGELYQAVLRKDPRASEIAKFYDYLEIQPLGNNEFLIGTENVQTQADLISINKQIVELGARLDIPVIATGDVHFLRPEDSLYRTILLAGQGFEDAEHQAPLYFRTTQEMLDEFHYLGEETAYQVVVTNPRALANKVQELTPVPQGLHPPNIEMAEEKLKELTYQTAHGLYGKPLPELVDKRIKRELESIIGNGYAPLYWIAHKLVKKSLDDGYLVGSRGSVGSSLVATMCNITEVNPLPPHYVCPSCRWHKFITDGSVATGVDLPGMTCPDCGGPAKKLGFDIPFEVFMGFHGDKVPDIDLNFSGEYQSNVHRYTEELFGKSHVFRAGTIGTLAEKTAYGFVKKYLDQTNQQKRNAEINRLVKKITGVRRTTGQHPGGMMVVPQDKEVYDFTPIQHPANDGSNGIVTTHFDYHAIHDSLVKLDILGHDDPTVLRMLEDVTKVPILDVPLDDEDTMKIFSSLETLGVTEEQIGTPVGTLGIPEFGTRFVRQMLIETRPKSFGELVRISGLSHGTNVWTSNAQELIAQKVTDLANVIACRDDIMVYLIQKGLEPGDAFRIMEQVRKGKGLKEEDMKLMKERKVPDWYIDSCQKISYMFPKAHAVAYVTMAFRIAYFKVHYPEAYYATYFSVRATDFDAHLVVQGEQRIRQEMEQISAKGNEATAKERNVVTILEIVLEAMARGIKFLPVDLYHSDDKRFLISERGLLAPLVALQGLGENAARSILAAREEGEFNSIEDLRQRSKVTKTVIEVLREHGCLDGMSETNQLTLF